MSAADYYSDVPRSTGEFMTAQGGFRLADDVHAWLDADRAPTAGHAPRRTDAAHDVDFWNRLEADIARRRQVRTPVHVQRAVMDALPAARGRAAPWHRRPLTITPALLAVGGIAMMALGVALGIALK